MFLLDNQRNILAKPITFKQLKKAYEENTQQ